LAGAKLDRSLHWSALVEQDVNRSFEQQDGLVAVVMPLAAMQGRARHANELKQMPVHRRWRLARLVDQSGSAMVSDPDLDRSQVERLADSCAHGDASQSDRHKSFLPYPARPTLACL
jgi:hypothetical protein